MRLVFYNLLKVLRNLFVGNSKTFVCFLQKGFTPLHVASSKGSRGIIEALVQHGASLNHQSKVSIIVYK
jgi:ankyrin repeat protein